MNVEANKEKKSDPRIIQDLVRGYMKFESVIQYRSRFSSQNFPISEERKEGILLIIKELLDRFPGNEVEIDLTIKRATIPNEIEKSNKFKDLRIELRERNEFLKSMLEKDGFIKITIVATVLLDCKRIAQIRL